MMPGDLQPLDKKFPIVDANGQPTLYFIKWAQQRQIDITAGITAAQAQALIDSWAAARDVIAGNGLDGGGSLANDITIDANASAILDLLSSTQGTVLYRGASAWAGLAPGTSGHFLKTNGSGANPEWASAGGGGGSLTLLEQHTASSSATLDFTTAITSTYDEYLIEIVNLIPATDAVQLLMRMSTDGGASYDSGGNYSWTVSGSNRFGQANSGADSGATQIQCNQSNIDNASTAGYSGSLRLFSPGSTSLHKAVNGVAMQLASDGTTVENAQIAGFYRSTTAVNAFRFLFSSGNIASGIIRVYGLAK